MDWLSDLLKTAKDYFGTPDGKIVLITIIVTGIVIVVLSYVIPAFGRFLRRLPKTIGRFSHMLKKWYRDWNYWRRFGTKYKIISNHKIEIAKIKNSSGTNLYELTMPLTMEFENGDELLKALVQCDNMQFVIYSLSIKGGGYLTI